MDSLPTAHLFMFPWSATFMPVNDLSWPMWEVWSCFYPATLEEARDADHIIQQDKDLIEMSHKEGKHIVGGLSACVTEETLQRSTYDRERLLKTCCLDMATHDMTSPQMWMRQAVQDDAKDFATLAALEWMMNPRLRGQASAVVRKPPVKDLRDPPSARQVEMLRSVQAYCATIQELDQSAVVDANGVQELRNDRGHAAAGVEACTIGGGGRNPKQYTGGVRKPALAAGLSQAAVTLADFEREALAETFTGDTLGLTPEDYKDTTKKYSTTFRLETIIGSMEAQAWELNPETWTQMVCGTRYTIDENEISWYGHLETLAEVTAKIQQAARDGGYGARTPSDGRQPHSELSTPSSPSKKGAEGATTQDNPLAAAAADASPSAKSPGVEHSARKRTRVLPTQDADKTKRAVDASEDSDEVPLATQFKVAGGAKKTTVPDAAPASPPPARRSQKRASTAEGKGSATKKKVAKKKVSALSTTSHEQNPGMCLACHPDNCDLPHSECDNRLKSGLVAPCAVQWIQADVANSQERGLFTTARVPARTWVSSFGPMQWAPGTALVNANGYRLRFRVETKLGQAVKWGTPKPGWATLHTAPYINHTCCEHCRNCEWWADDHADTFNVLTTRALSRGEELLANYVTGESPPYSLHFRRLFKETCACCACRGTTKNCWALPAAAGPSATLQHVSKH